MCEKRVPGLRTHYKTCRAAGGPAPARDNVFCSVNLRVPTPDTAVRCILRRSHSRTNSVHCWSLPE